MKATITEAGKLPIPEELRLEMHLEPGQTVLWEQIDPTEWRVVILPQENELTEDQPKPDPFAALGFARRHGLEEGTTAEWMKRIRGDDWEE